MCISLISIFGSIVLFAVFGEVSLGGEVNAKTNLILQGDIEFVYFRASTFRMGCPSNPPAPWMVEDSAQPEHVVSLSAYYLSKYPITVQQFVAFLNAVGIKEDHADRSILLKSVDITKEGRFIARDRMPSRPITGVTHEGAKAFCAWLGTNTGQQCRLPTEAEWEYAACGSSGRVYPWGNEIKNASVWNDEIGQHPELATVDGVHDLNGPVVQWCLDGFDAQFYTKDPVDNPLNAIGDGRFVLRGGPMMRCGKNEELFFPPVWKRFARQTVDRTIPHIGFRVVVVPSVK